VTSVEAIEPGVAVDEVSLNSARTPSALVAQAERFPPVGKEELGQLAALFENLLERAREAALEPAHVKKLRTWNAMEVATLLGMTDDSLRRRLKKDLTERENPQKSSLLADLPPLPQGTLRNGRRHFTLEEIHALQKALWSQPKRDPAQDDPLVLSVCNFKGGVAKTTTALHLAQYLVLHGYRVLLIDLDAQATLTQQFGILPHIDVPESQTALPFFEGPRIAGDQWTGTLRTAIRTTYWHNLDLVCANLAFYGADFSLASRLTQEQTFRFYRVLAEGLETVKHDYDVIVIDTAPSLSFVNANAIFAINAFIVAMPPAMMELQSGGLFFRWLEELATLFEQAETRDKMYDFVALLITKMKSVAREGQARRAKPAHEEIRDWLQAYFPKYLVSTQMLESSALQKISQGLLTLYEVSTYESDKRTFDRAVQAMNAVNAEIESAIQAAWQRRRMQRAALTTPAQVA
jgi:chromosome partitioning protein